MGEELPLAPKAVELFGVQVSAVRWRNRCQIKDALSVSHGRFAGAAVSYALRALNRGRAALWSRAEPLRQDRTASCGSETAGWGSLLTDEIEGPPDGGPQRPFYQSRSVGGSPRPRW